MNLLDFLLPVRGRQRPPPNETANAATLARLDESDPVYRLCLDHAHVAAHNALAELLDPRCTDAQMQYYRGRLAGLTGHIEELETLRRAWHEQQKQTPAQPAKERGVL